MKASRGAALIVVLGLAGAAYWSGRRDSGAETSVSALPDSPPIEREVGAVHAPAPIGGSTLNPAKDRDAERVQRLVREMKDLMDRASGLSADDIGEFELLANLTNEFDNGLDLEKAALLVRHMPAGFLATAWGDLALRRWAREDRAAAAAWMAEHPDPSPMAATALMHGWFFEDKVAARDYVAELPEGPWKTNTATSAAEEALVAEAPVDLLDFLSLPQGENPRRAELQEWAAIMWGKNHYNDAIAWASGASDVAQQERLIAAVNVGHANTDPLMAAEALLARVKSAEVVAPALGSIVRIWSGKEPGSAAQWVASFPAGPEKAKAVEQLLEVWGHNDPSAAKIWADGLEDKGARAVAEQVLSAIEADRAPQSAGG